MKRLQISLEPELHLALDREAKRAGVSKAEVVRQSLRERIDPPPPIDEDPLFKLFGTASGGLREGESIDDVVYGPRK